MYKKEIVFLIFVTFTWLFICSATERVDWKARAGFYTSNYPDCSSNEKAKMLADDMRRAKAKPIVVEKLYTVRVLYVYDCDGQQLFPIEEVTKKGEFRELGELAKEVDWLSKKLK